MRVKEVAELVGISVRTLHYYDEIGLLTPKSTTDTGYRIYSQEDIELLQQILFFRELDFPLKEIKQIINSPSFRQEEALLMHKKVLIERRSRIDEMLGTIEKTIKHLRGEIDMTNKERFAGFDFSKNPYEKEARQRFGSQAVDASNQRLKAMSQAEQGAFVEEMNKIYTKLAAIRHSSPESPEAQEAIREWFVALNKIGTYSLEAFKGLGQMYVADERFTENIDRFGEGLAKFMSEAMSIYADTHK